MSESDFDKIIAMGIVQRALNDVLTGPSSNVFSSNISNVVSISTIVQLDMNGDTILCNNLSKFSHTKDDSKELLGSVEKINDNEILVADAVNKRAIIIDVLTNRIKWEYNSDRYILDAHLIPKSDILIVIDQSDYNSKDLVINKGQIIIWQNDTNDAITIYSGDISDVDISVEFNANLYGQVFKSPVLNYGDRWSYKPPVQGEYKWFSYPNAYKGTIKVLNEYVYSNDQFIVLESDLLESPYSSKVLKIDTWGNVLQEFGNDGFLVKPRDARPLLNKKILIST